MKKLCHIFTKVLVELFFITPLVASESASANKTIFKVGNKKESVTKSSFSKASGSSCKQRRKQVFASLLQGSEHTLTQFKNKQPQIYQIL